MQFHESRLILKVYAGSRSYGMDTPDSDDDYRGICIPPSNYLVGLREFEQYENCNGCDEVIYSLHKFVKLALANNPNIFDALFVVPDHILFINEFGRELRDLRYRFLSKRVYYTYGGYAYSRLKRLTEDGKRPIGKKADLIERYGYDTKDAAHLIRLLRMGIEILRDGEVNVLRDDAQELLAIRNGKYTLDGIVREAARLQVFLDDANANSTLPSTPDYDTVDDWLTSIHIRSLDWGGN